MFFGSIAGSDLYQSVLKYKNRLYWILVYNGLYISGHIGMYYYQYVSPCYHYALP